MLFDETTGFFVPASPTTSGTSKDDVYIEDVQQKKLKKKTLEHHLAETTSALKIYFEKKEEDPLKLFCISLYDSMKEIDKKN